MVYYGYCQTSELFENFLEHLTLNMNGLWMTMGEFLFLKQKSTRSTSERSSVVTVGRRRFRHTSGWLPASSASELSKGAGPGAYISKLPVLSNFLSEEEQVAQLPQSSEEGICRNSVHWNRNDTMSISLLTACHSRESNKQLHQAKLNSSQIQMHGPHQSCSMWKKQSL